MTADCALCDHPPHEGRCVAAVGVVCGPDGFTELCGCPVYETQCTEEED